MKLSAICQGNSVAERRKNKMLAEKELIGPGGNLPGLLPGEAKGSYAFHGKP